MPNLSSPANMIFHRPCKLCRLWFVAVVLAMLMPFAVTAQGLATTAPAILYDSHSNQARKLFVLTSGQPLRQIAAVDGWYKVLTYNDKSGWVQANQVRPWSGAVTVADNVPVYTTTVPGGSTVFYAAKHVLLEVLNVQGAWVEVLHKDGETGYVVFNQLWLNNPL